MDKDHKNEKSYGSRSQNELHVKDLTLRRRVTVRDFTVWTTELSLAVTLFPENAPAPSPSFTSPPLLCVGCGWLSMALVVFGRPTRRVGWDTGVGLYIHHPQPGFQLILHACKGM